MNFIHEIASLIRAKFELEASVEDLAAAITDWHKTKPSDKKSVLCVKLGLDWYAIDPPAGLAD